MTNESKVQAKAWLTQQTQQRDETAVVELQKLLTQLQANNFRELSLDSRDGELFCHIQLAHKYLNLDRYEGAAQSMAEAIKVRRRYDLSYVNLAKLLRTYAALLTHVPNREAERLEVLKEAAVAFDAEINELDIQRTQNLHNLERAIQCAKQEAEQKAQKNAPWWITAKER